MSPDQKKKKEEYKYHSKMRVLANQRVLATSIRVFSEKA